ncbi:hypothetical protein PENTCL1PPCAC_961, partial [Pristionchus entomophagus]
MSEWVRGKKVCVLKLEYSKIDFLKFISASILDNLKSEFWRLRPEAQKVARFTVYPSHNDHQRQGIAQHLVHLGLDFGRLRSSVLDGIMSEASYIANQTLLAKNGYEALASSKRKEYIRSNGEPVVFPDATTSVKLFYLNLKQ